MFFNNIFIKYIQIYRYNYTVIIQKLQHENFMSFCLMYKKEEKT